VVVRLRKICRDVRSYVSTDKKIETHGGASLHKIVAVDYSPIIIMPEAWLPLGVAIGSIANLIGIVRATSTS